MCMILCLTWGLQAIHHASDVRCIHYGRVRPYKTSKVNVNYYRSVFSGDFRWKIQLRDIFIFIGGIACKSRFINRWRREEVSSLLISDKYIAIELCTSLYCVLFSPNDIILLYYKRCVKVLNVEESLLEIHRRRWWFLLATRPHSV